MSQLSKARLFSWHIAPLLHHRLLHLSGVGLRSDTHLLGDVKAILNLDKLRDQLGHMLACSLWVQTASLLWFVSDHSLCLLITLFDALNKTTASWSAELNRNLVALGERSVLGGLLLR